MVRIVFIGVLVGALLSSAGCLIEGWDPGYGKRDRDAGGNITTWDLMPEDEFDMGTLVPSQWIKVKAGTFSMGSPTTEKCRQPAGVPETQHQVTLSRDFEILTTEVTQKQFESLLGFNPSRFSTCGGTCPVEQVQWRTATAYCNALSRVRGYKRCYYCKGSGIALSCQVPGTYHHSEIYKCPGYRLPTEAEWEYAYRAGSTTAFYGGEIQTCDGNDDTLAPLAWYLRNSNLTTHPVAQKKPNAWGLYDMAGNVWEYCHDWLQQDLGKQAINDPMGMEPGKLPQRLLKGGSALLYPQEARAAFREGYNPALPDKGEPRIIGFRCVRTLNP